ncbi:MAG: HEAT repeat domain-containing protein [Bacteroidetes bacterium]|nr:HEAT repeat domain-containing protein [Bacteroidota bacterium]
MRVLVLDVSLASTDSLDAFADALHAAGHALGAPFEHAGDDAHATAQMQRFRSEAGVTVELVDDHDARARYVEVLTSEDERRALVLDVLMRALPVVPLARLVDDAYAAPTPDALLRLALATPLPPPERVAEVVATALAHPDAALRLAAVEAVGLIGLPPFIEPMQRLRADDPDDDVRTYADQTYRMLHG